ncbi:hypothetical protein MSG28_003864 [Choristoneura fumiferana]|uniref:Uncharacterized protein n=1 Tax=Choristoneura fumiferana TaxID=7141 RepID=A0ACC0KGH4_CHOFU|nr:hypothetical protein MSG28_003864 [Choristoneura fumiferana]
MPKRDKPLVLLEEFRVKNAPEDYGMADKKWNFKKFVKGFSIDIKRMENSEMEFDLIGIQPAFANAFRRLMLSEVPSMAIEKVMIKNNTSIIQDEVLAHRLGLIPLKADPRLFEYRPEDATEGTEFDTLEFTLKVKCTANTAQSKDSYRTEDLYINHSATASYRLLPEIKLTREVSGSQATLLQSCFSPGVIGLGPDGKAFVRDARYDTCSRKCLQI